MHIKRRIPPSKRTSDLTSERILCAAERLFLEHGYDGSSVRMVAAQAGVNLAAANYHFGGKDELFQSMLARRLDLLNEARRALLDEYEASANSTALSAARILAAMCVPALRLARDATVGGPDFLRLLGRAYVDPSPTLRIFLSERYADVIARFKDSFGRALPHLSRQELSWRLHFTLGALSYTLAGTDAWKLIAALNPRETGNDATLLARLMPFLVAGLEAPLPNLNGDTTLATDSLATSPKLRSKRLAARIGDRP